MGTDKMPVRPGRPCAAMAMATRLMAETGMMMPASGSDGSCWSKVAEMQQLRMPPHERQWSTTLLPLSRSRTPPSRSQHLHSCTLEDRVAARISLLGRGCGALGAERGNKTSERVVSPFCPLLDPPRFRTSRPAHGDENLVEKDKNPEEWWPWKLDPRNGHCATPSQWSRRKSREISGIVTENTRF